MMGKKIKQAILSVIILVMLAGTSTSYASIKIKSVKVKIGLEDFNEYGEPEFEIEAQNDNYEVGDFVLTSGSFLEIGPGTGPGAEDEGEQPEFIQSQSEEVIYEIEVNAEDGYYFDTMEQKNIKLSGIDSICTKAVRKDNGSTLLLTVKVTGLDKIVGAIEEAGFSSHGLAEWREAGNAATYSVTLYKDSKKLGNMHITSGTTFDFSPLMKEEGVYYYKVYPLSATDKKGKVVESGRQKVDLQTAKSNNNQYSVIANSADSKWQMDSSGWKYRYSDGTYIQNNWIESEADGAWYYFGSDGYMLTDIWQMWKKKWYYLSEDGRMLTDTTMKDENEKLKSQSYVPVEQWTE